MGTAPNEAVAGFEDGGGATRQGRQAAPRGWKRQERLLLRASQRKVILLTL